MKFNEAWEYLEENKLFSVTIEKKLADFENSLQSILRNDRDLSDDYIVRSTSTALQRIMDIDYCYIDNLMSVTIWQPKLIDKRVERDMDKEAFTEEATTFEECIIKLALSVESFTAH